MKNQELISILNRRRFIKNAVVASAGAVLSSSLFQACKEEEGPFTPEGDFGFFEGVASFDPSQDQVMLWTRYTMAGNESGNPEIMLDVAIEEDFADGSIIASTSVAIDMASDFTIRVDVQNLQANTPYFYRFRNDRTGAISVTGQTKTLPANGQVEAVKMAVVSCANFQAGLFNVYGAVAESDADVVVHLGDYIYEYGAGGFGTNEETDLLDRAHRPAGELLSLEDYRERYRQYRSDVQLQEAHRLKPFICVWDDHEIANNVYLNGAENHQADEGDFATRKANALQAWYEYLPVRVTDQARIYRSFDFGGIADLIMLDTRVIGRDQQLNYLDYFINDTDLDRDAFTADWLAPDRTILGREQRDWLLSEIGRSSGSWQVLGNQVLMGKYTVPAELIGLSTELVSGDITPELITEYQGLLLELTQIKNRIINNDPTVTAAERARVETVLPYNLDAWDGYPAEREMIFASATNKKLISIAGDTHNAWHAQLTDANQNQVGTEFATSSVTSPGSERFIGTNPTTLFGFQFANQLLIDDLQYMDASQRGFVMLTLTHAGAKSEWFFVGGLDVVDTSTILGRTAVV